jgi:hypothetical protein
VPRLNATVLTISAALAASLAGTVLTGCSQTEDAARAAASRAVTKAASSAADTVKRKAQSEALSQVCGLTRGSGPLADGKVSGEDRALAASVASVAQQAGVPARYTEPLATLGDSEAGRAATTKAIDALKQSCGRQGQG